MVVTGMSIVQYILEVPAHSNIFGLQIVFQVARVYAIGGLRVQYALVVGMLLIPANIAEMVKPFAFCYNIWY